MRYVIHDEDGPLRAFRTRAAAVAWMAPGMWLRVLPKPTPHARYFKTLNSLGDALI